MQMRWFPSRDFVIQSQDYLVRQFGGAIGIRDEESLSLALHPPEPDRYESIAAEAAALMDNLYRLRPFVDGNKRTATTVGEVFLYQNGYYIAVDDDFDAYDFFMELFDEEKFLLENLHRWLVEHVQPLL